MLAYSNVFEFSAAILEKGLLPEDCLVEKLQQVFQNRMFLLCQYGGEHHLRTKLV